MYLKTILLYLLALNIYANSQIDNINSFLNASRFSYEQVTENSTEVISGEYSKNDFPIISIISKKKIPQDDDSLNVITLEDSVYITDKLTKQVFKISLREEETLIIQFKDNFGTGNSIFLNKLS